MFNKVEKNEIKSTAHSKYRCQYHIVFAPKYRRKVFHQENENLKKLYESYAMGKITEHRFVMLPAEYENVKKLW